MTRKALAVALILVGTSPAFAARIIVTKGTLACIDQRDTAKIGVLGMRSADSGAYLEFYKNHMKDCTLLGAGEEVVIRKRDGQWICVNHVKKGADPNDDACYWTVAGMVMED
jgi:hypothetical protein